MEKETAEKFRKILDIIKDLNEAKDKKLFEDIVLQLLNRLDGYVTAILENKNK